MAAARLVEDDEKAPLEESVCPFHWSLAGGLDYATAYIHRGYLHQDSGLILQPYATGACDWQATPALTLTPYVTFWNSIDLDSPNTGGGAAAAFPCAILHHHAFSFGGSIPGLNTTSWANGSLKGTGADWYQSEWMIGVLTRTRNLWLDLRYTFYAYPTGLFFPIQEIGGKLSYDVASWWREPEPDSGFFLRPYVSLFQETFNHYDDNGTYFEAGLEPSFRCEICGQKVGITLPAALGMSLNNYYVASDGNNEFFGYFSLGVVASVALPMPTRLGNWYVSGSVIYYHLLADSLKSIDGTSDLVVGRVGLGFTF